jgi:hypothetical protein
MAMDAELFKRLAQEKPKLSAKSLEAARLVMVEGMRPGEAAVQMGLLPAQVSRTTRGLYEAEAELRETGKLASVSTSLVERNLDASYTVAVTQARGLMGDDAVVRAAEPNRSYSGTAVVRTDLHLVQDLGRGSLVVHELAKLDRVPTLGQSLDVSYSDDLRRPARVATQEMTLKRGGISR